MESSNTGARIKDKIFRRISMGYIVGTEVEDAIQACQKIMPLGYAATICPWNNNGDDFSLVADAYVLAARQIIRHNLDCYLSIKTPAIGFDPTLMDKIIKAAREGGLRIHFDAQSPETAEDNLSLFEATYNKYENISYTLPARWQRSLEDAGRLIGMQVPVRIVKGEWEDPLEPDKDPFGGFLDIVRVLAGKARHVAVATHNAPLLKEACHILRRENGSWELEQLYGLPMKTVRLAESCHVPVRFYIPYGRACLPYALSMMKKKPRMLWWVMRDIVRADRFKIA
ncbi:MAG TPA: hypothetical protein ENJ10_11825 [Caldithrix abyssi]|uniref:Proline dehydrogenase n=1 Tax=Caldithrix abyssi TaxID=187145 RepID=A0A7V1M184_CALAY|nr:hypothetical protein [Caldithrix abyssi]